MKTNRAFRTAQRHNIRIALYALRALMVDAHNTPAFWKISEALRNTVGAKELLSVKRWKR